MSLSQSSLPVFEIGLNALSAVLDRAVAFAAARNIDPSVLLNSRLSPDMYPLVRQVQIASDQAKNGSARLAGIEPPRYEDDETTFDQLKARIPPHCRLRNPAASWRRHRQAGLFGAIPLTIS